MFLQSLSIPGFLVRLYLMSLYRTISVSLMSIVLRFRFVETCELTRKSAQQRAISLTPLSNRRISLASNASVSELSDSRVGWSCQLALRRAITSVMVSGHQRAATDRIAQDTSMSPSVCLYRGWSTQAAMGGAGCQNALVHLSQTWHVL